MDNNNTIQPINPNVPPSQSPNLQNPIKKLRGKFLIIGGVIVLLLVIGGLGYFLTTSNKAKLQNNQANQSTTTPIPSPNSTKNTIQPEDFNAIKGDVKLSYFYDPQDNERIILRQVDFNTNKSSDIILPFLAKNTRDESKRGKYKVSPNGKYILKLTRNKLEIANLPNPIFRTVHSVESITDPKWQETGERIGQNFDFAHMDDAMWDNQGKLYFITGVGLDGVGAPEGGAYTDLYVANEDGSNVRLINDHTKENQKYGFMKHFSYIDTAKNEIYFSGDSHGGHLATMIVVDSTNGVLKQSLKDIYTDLVNPVFNKNFSKAYYEQDFKEEGYAYPVKIYDYDMNSKSKKLIYSVPNVTEDYTSPQIENYPSGALYIHQDQNKLYFQVREGKTVHFYTYDLTSGGNPKLLFDDNGTCERKDVSTNGDYIFLLCKDAQAKTNEYQFYQLSSEKRFTFYKEGFGEDFRDPTIQVVNF